MWLQSAQIVFLTMLALTVGTSAAACSETKPCVEELGQGMPFDQPVQLNSSEKSWRFQMNVDIGEIQYGWLKLKRRMYNGKIVGPTWTVKKGDIINVNLINRLSIEGNDLGRNETNSQNYPNTTNLHTHGLHISSKDPQDNVLVHVWPEETHNYTYKIHPKNPSGTNWYHAHVHRSTMFQVHSGLSGMIIVQDEVANMPAELESVSRPNNCAKDKQMIFQPILQYTGKRRGFGQLQAGIEDSMAFRQDDIMTDYNISLRSWMLQNLNFMTTNGLLKPVLEMIPGQIYRFRMVNAGGNAALEIFITDQGDDQIKPTTHCEVREISIDGVYLDKPRSLQPNGQSFLTPAARVEWMVKCNTPGKYELKSWHLERQTLSIGEMTSYNDVLVTLNVTGQAVNPVQNFPVTLPPRPSFMKDLQNVPQSEIDGRFVVELDPDQQLNREHWVNGSYYRYKMRVGKTQEWHLVNTETEAAHPLHIHVNQFQVISYNKYTGGYGAQNNASWALYRVNDLEIPCDFQRNGISDDLPDNTHADSKTLYYLGHDERFALGGDNTLGYSRKGDWRDVVLVPPLSNITIRFTPHEFTCDVIIHCHILAHEDEGMMMITEIVGKDESLEANVKSGNAYPGTCDKCDRYPFNNQMTLSSPCGDAISPAISIFAIVASLMISHVLQVISWM